MVNNNKVCDIVGCDDKAAEVMAAENADGPLTVNMCSFHYRDYMSDESIGKAFNL
jgi:hypothetical protein